MHERRWWEMRKPGYRATGRPMWESPGEGMLQLLHRLQCTPPHDCRTKGQKQVVPIQAAGCPLRWAEFAARKWRSERNGRRSLLAAEKREAARWWAIHSHSVTLQFGVDTDMVMTVASWESCCQRRDCWRQLRKEKARPVLKRAVVLSERQLPLLQLTASYRCCRRSQRVTSLLVEREESRQAASDCKAAGRRRAASGLVVATRLDRERGRTWGECLRVCVMRSMHE